MDINQSDTQLRHAKIDLMTKSVFLSTICLSLKHHFTEDISTAATNGLSIIYNPDFLNIHLFLFTQLIIFLYYVFSFLAL